MRLMAATTPKGDLFSGAHADRYIAEWLTGLNLLWRKMQRRREAMRPQEGPAAAASNEALASVFQRLPPKSATACRAVCLRWSVLLSSPRLDAGAGADGSSAACFAGRDGVSAEQSRGRRRRGAGTMLPVAAWRAPLPKHQYRQFRKKQGYRGMF